MDNQILVSIVIPCYNKAAFLPETLDSILQQSCSSWEVIMVNDGSSDHTKEVAMKYVSKYNRMKYLEQENGGASAARNVGIRHAQGTFILPLDADDTIESTYVEKALKAFELRPTLRLVYCYARFFGLKEGFWEGLYYQGYPRLLLRNSIFCSAFFRKSDWLQAGGYDENMKKGHEDWEFFIRLLQGEGEVYQIPEVLFNYRIQEVSLTTTAVQERVMQETELYIYTKNHHLYTRYLGQNLFDCLREWYDMCERRKRHKNKWYRRLFYKYFKK